MRRSSSTGSASGVRVSTSSSSPAATPKAPSTFSRVARPVRSEQEIPTWSASTSRSWTPGRAGGGDDLGRPARDPGQHGVEERAVHHLDAGLAQRRGEHGGVPVGAARDGAQPLGAVVDGVHRRHDGEQHLGGADVGGRLVAADVLLAGLQRQAVRRTPLGVDGHADQPAGQVPLEAGGDRHVAGVRAAVEERDAEALGGADDDVGAELAGRLEQREREQVGGHDELARRARRRPRPARAGRGSGRRRRGTAAARRRARPSGRPSARSATTTSMPIASARVRTTSMVCGSASASTTNGPGRLAVARGVPASSPRPTAVPSSSREALAVGRPVRSPTTVWKLSSASSRPWEISGW